jgi:ethanolamine ammonia-lyase small subunit
MPFHDATIAAKVEQLNQCVIRVASAATDRDAYLKRPDLGRRLDGPSRQLLEHIPGEHDLAIIITDGLSAAAVHHHAFAVLRELLRLLPREDWRIAPVIIARFGRVALQDEVGAILHARIALTLIGERPGLGTPDSLGAYLVHNPRIGRNDADRNCVSNIHAKGMSPAAAAKTIHWLISESRRRAISGIALKNESPRLPSA